jgi:FixJ family two-component response regulator
MKLSSAKICLVDGDSASRFRHLEWLEATGYKVEAYATAKGFLSASTPSSPTCLILDVELPDMSGVDLQRLLRERGRSEQLIFVTGRCSIEACVAAMKAGAVDFFAKPVAKSVLLETVELALKRSANLATKRAIQREAHSRLSLLTNRQMEVLELLIRGMSNRSVAQALGATEATIKIHRRRIMEKMTADSLPELVALAREAGVKVPWQMTFRSELVTGPAIRSSD